MKILNPKSEILKYLKKWLEIILRPIYFYTKLKGEEWKNEPLSFLLMTSWILAFAAALVIFIIQYIPIGKTLVEGVSGVKFLFILPVLLTIIFVFFMITFLILGGVFVSLLFTVLYLSALVLHYIYQFFGGKGSLNQKIQMVFYSSAVFLFALAIFALVLLTKFTAFSFEYFRYGYNFIYFLMLLYVYGLWAVSGRKNYGLSKGKAFLGAIVPLLVLLIFGLLFDKIALSKLAPWIS